MGQENMRTFPVLFIPNKQSFTLNIYSERRTNQELFTDLRMNAKIYRQLNTE